MYTQVTCPNCRTPFSAEVHQVIDAGQNPELKQRLLSGQINVAMCPSCGMGGQMASALLFHDPAYEMFMVHVPEELNLSHVDREKLIGQLAQQAMNNVPTEQRRAYMLQPQMMLSMQSFMEKVLETEGITPEMIARQRKQAEFLQTLAKADKDVADYLVKERAKEIDETFFAMLQAHIDAVAEANDNKQLLSLTNLRARLMTETPVGRKLEKQQIALHAMSRDAKKANAMSPEILLKHLLLNQEDEEIVDGLVNAGRGALTYSFFSLLTAEIEKAETESRAAAAQRLTELREKLLVIFDALQEESQRVLQEAEETLKGILAAPSREDAVRASMADIDDAFMYVLSARAAEAEQSGDAEGMRALNDIHALIMKQVESQYPPEVMLLNQLMEARTENDQQQILDENQHMVTPELVKVLEAVTKEIEGSDRNELTGRLNSIQAMVESRL